MTEAPPDHTGITTVTRTLPPAATGPQPCLPLPRRYRLRARPRPVPPVHPACRCRFATALLGDAIYVIAGTALAGFQGGPSDSVLVYNITANTWTVGPRLVAPRIDACAAALDGKVCVLDDGARERACITHYGAVVWLYIPAVVGQYRRMPVYGIYRREVPPAPVLARSVAASHFCAAWASSDPSDPSHRSTSSAAMTPRMCP